MQQWLPSEASPPFHTYDTSRYQAHYGLVFQYAECVRSEDLEQKLGGHLERISPHAHCEHCGHGQQDYFGNSVLDLALN